MSVVVNVNSGHRKIYEKCLSMRWKALINAGSINGALLSQNLWLWSLKTHIIYHKDDPIFSLDKGKGSKLRKHQSAKEIVAHCIESHK